MMIAVLHPITRLIVGGAQENTMYTAMMLDQYRYQVEVLSGPQTGSEGSLIEEMRSNGVLLTILPDLVRQVNPWHDTRALISLIRLMRRKRYIIVHTHSSKAGILGRLAAHLAGVPVIVHTIHGWSFHDYMVPWVRWMYIFLERWMASFSSALVAVSEHDIRKGVRNGIGTPAQYRLIRSAIPLEQFDQAHIDRQAIRMELGIPPEVVVIGNVGRFSPQKNPLDWISIASLVAQAAPEAHFLLVGDGPLHSQVVEALKASGLADRTILTGLRRDVPRMLAAMDIFLLTSLWEGLPRVLPQAMAMGLPIIANRADGIQEAVHDGQNGFLCFPGDIGIMVKYCIELIKDPLRRHSMGQQGQAIVMQDFDLRKMIVQIEQLYEELLVKSNGWLL